MTDIWWLEEDGEENLTFGSIGREARSQIFVCEIFKNFAKILAIGWCFDGELVAEIIPDMGIHIFGVFLKRWNPQTRGKSWFYFSFCQRVLYESFSI